MRRPPIGCLAFLGLLVVPPLMIAKIQWRPPRTEAEKRLFYLKRSSTPNLAAREATP